MRGLLRRLDVNGVVHDSLDATLTHAVNLVEEDDVERLSDSLSLPGAAEGELSFAITHTIPGRSSAERISDVLAASAYAAARSTELLLLTRLHVAVDELRLGDADPLAGVELHDIASTLQ